MAKPSFSPTKLATYLRCPLQYRFAYILKLSRYYGRARAGYALGGSLHRTVQALHAQGGTENVSQEQLLEKYRQTWQGAGFATAEEEREHFEAGLEMVKEFYSTEAELPTQTLFCEKTLKQDRGDYLLTGKIDRLDRYPDGTLEIVDYKSGRSSLTDEDVLDNVGLRVYEVLIRHLYPESPLRIALYALRIGEKVSLLRTGEETQATGEMLDALALQILADEAFPGRPINNCPDCDFRRACPVYKPKGYPTLKESEE